MDSLLRPIDALLNRITMYKVVAFGLIGLLAVAVVLAFAGVTGLSGVGLLLSASLLVVVCGVTDKLFSWLLRVPSNSESWLISALILACIVPPATSWERAGWLALLAVVAMVSKYVITWRGRHFLNPAAFGAFVMSVSGLLPVTWWVATPYMLPATVVLALVVLRKQRQYTVFGVFAITAVAMLLLVGVVLQDQPVLSILRLALLSWPLVFMGSIMLTEPSTLPAGRYYRLLFAVVVGVIFASQQHIGPLRSTPQAALLAGNIFTLLAVPAFGVLVRPRWAHEIAPGIHEFGFEKPSRFTFIPGQYADWTLSHRRPDIRGNRRTFSLASAPSEPELIFTTRITPGGSSFKQALLSLKSEQPIRVANVAGSFVLPGGNVPVLLVAGGIGITPFRSMVAEQLNRNLQRDISLVYSSGNEQEFVYLDLFRQAASVGVTLHTVVGRASAEQLLQLVPDAASRQVYISGPEAMVTALRHDLRKHGLSSRQLHTDRFSGY